LEIADGDDEVNGVTRISLGQIGIKHIGKATTGVQWQHVGFWEAHPKHLRRSQEYQTTHTSVHAQRTCIPSKHAESSPPNLELRF